MLPPRSDCIRVSVLPDTDAHTHTHTNKKTNGLEIPDEKMEDFLSEGTCVGESEQVRVLFPGPVIPSAPLLATQASPLKVVFSTLPAISDSWPGLQT